MATVEDTSDFIDISDKQDRGILKKVTKEGISEIKPCKHDKVYVHYVGTYFGGDQHGKKFDSSRDNDEKFSFNLMKGEVIKAWDVCVATMKIGEICELIASPEYAYPEDGCMKFEIELFSVEGQDVSTKNDGSVRKSIVKEGDGHCNPCGGFSVTINYERITPSGRSDFKELTYTVGDYEVAGIPKGIDVGIRSMLLNEEARIKFQECPVDKSSFGDDTHGGFQTYSVIVTAFDKIKRINSFPKFEEQINYANTLKDKANEYLKAQKYCLALELYERINSDISYVVPHGPPETATLNSLKVAIFNNIALSHLKVKNAEKCIFNCNEALAIDFKSEKALFRKGQAEILRNDPEEAIKHFTALNHYYPENKAGIQQLNMCKVTVNKMNSDVKKKFRNIFIKCEDKGLGVVDNAPIDVAESSGSDEEYEKFESPEPEKTAA